MCESQPRKGWQEVPSGGDVTVNTFGTTREKQTLNTYYDYLGGGWFFGGFGQSTTTTEAYREGPLIVEMFDTNNKHVRFRGVSQNELSKEADKNVQELDKNMNKMFERFPSNGQNG